MKEPSLEIKYLTLSLSIILSAVWVTQAKAIEHSGEIREFRRSTAADKPSAKTRAAHQASPVVPASKAPATKSPATSPDTLVPAPASVPAVVNPSIAPAVSPAAIPIVSPSATSPNATPPDTLPVSGGTSQTTPIAPTAPTATEASSPINKMSAKPTSSRITVPQTILPLPGSLDSTPFVASNCPEIVLESGILLSTFAKEDKAHPDAHLNHPLTGKFDVFFHHITNATKVGTKHTLYLGMLVGNASNKKVHVQILQAVSHLTKPDSPFKELDTVLDNEKGRIYAGPGDRVMLDLLRDHKQSGWHHDITLDPGEIKVLYSLPIPTPSLLHPLNGRTGVIRMNSDGPVYLASLSAFSKKKLFGEHKPDDTTWKAVLDSKGLVQPRDKAPSAPGAKGHLIYGRVAGVAKGSTWQGKVTTDAAHERLSILPNQMISYPINTVIGGTFGTDQVQAAPMLVRYADSAYQSHGNYGVLYDLTLPLYNESAEQAVVGISFQSPIKENNKAEHLQFFAQPPDQVVFRGTVSFEWTDDTKKQNHKLIHLVEKRGQSVHPLIELLIKPHALQEVSFRFLYPADCTPPHVLTITTVTQPH